MIKRTAVFFELFDEAPKFFVFDGDHSDLNGVLINGFNDHDRIARLSSLVMDAEYRYVPGVSLEAMREALLDPSVALITAGFLP